MHQSICPTWKLLLLVLSSVFGFTRADPPFERPPQVTEVSLKTTPYQASDIVIVAESASKNFTFTCSASGEPKPSIQWRCNDVPVISSTFVTNYNNGTLFFPEFSKREDGYYQCVAKNLHGTSLSTKYLIVMAKNPTGDGKDRDKEASYSREEGQPFSFSCEETSSTIRKFIKRWYRTSESRALVDSSERRGSDIEGNMRFAYLKRGEDEMTYQCGITPHDVIYADTTTWLNKVTLTISPGQLKESTPRLEFMTGNGQVQAFLDRNLTLECFFSGYPAPNITWKDASTNEITEGGNKRFLLEDFNRRLILFPVKEEDNGAFYCTANNGVDTAVQRINLNVTSAPLKVKNQNQRLSSRIEPDRSDVTLTCLAQSVLGQRLDTPVWYRNGELLTNNNLPYPSRYTFSQDATQLTIRNITMNVDTACFQCNVTNSEGFAFYDGSLRVIESISIIHKPKEVMTAEDGAINISVLFTADACCPIKPVWEFNGQTLTSDEQDTRPLMYDSTTRISLFNTTGVSESLVKSRLGKYRVIVANVYQSVVVEFSINRKGAEAVEAAGAGFQLWWLAIILGVLAIIIAILIIVCCVKRNFPRQTYQLGKTELKHNLNPEEDLLDQSFQEI